MKEIQEKIYSKGHCELTLVGNIKTDNLIFAKFICNHCDALTVYTSKDMEVISIANIMDNFLSKHENCKNLNSVKK